MLIDDPTIINSTKVPYLDPGQVGNLITSDGTNWQSVAPTALGGPQGATGDIGPQGDVGSQGPQGNDGAQGSIGSVGPQGNQGPIGITGEQGPQGNQGIRGAQGPDGIIGETGPIGVIGPQGNQGSIGSVGSIGPQGNQGDNGAQGNQGNIGDIGATGLQGPQGNQGNDGDIGAQGSVGAASTITGPTGSIGAQGNQGNQGDVGAQGNQGNQGNAGAQGNQGNQGAQGDYGPTGIQGNQGNQGIDGGNAGKIFYLSYGASSTGITGYKVADHLPSSEAEVNAVTSVTSTTDVLIDEFITESGYPNATSLPPGTAFRHIHCKTDGPVNVARLKLDLYQRNLAGTETLLRSGYSDDFSGTAIRELIWSFADGNGYTLLDTDRLVFKLYAARVSGAATFNVTTYYQGTNNSSYVQTTITAGSVGPQGVTGPTGLAGSNGTTGPTGSDGAQGNQGNQGNQGPQGDIGSNGIDGITGAQGNQGPQGDIGAQGNQGDIGPQGYTGDIGPQGNQGDAGAQGAQGYTGDIGPQGNQGDIGPQGNQGDIGAQGFTGAGIYNKGDWNPIATYNTGDIVMTLSPGGGGQPTSWISNIDNNIAIPDNVDTAEWTILTWAGAQGAQGAEGPGFTWIGAIDGTNSTATFNVNEIFSETTLLNDSQLYKVVNAFTGDGTDATFISNVTSLCVKFVETTANKGVWSAAINYPKGNIVISDVAPVDAAAYSYISKLDANVGNALPVASDANWDVLTFNGSQGNQGDIGAQGLQGAQGNQGIDGSAVNTGAQGPQGDIGAQGPQGDIGSNGTDGVTGPTGIAGGAGSTGPTGIAGGAGSTGPTGPSPNFINNMNIQTGTVYTAVLADQSKLVSLTNGSPVKVYIPTNAVVGFPIGTEIDFLQSGAGKVTFTGASVTINSKSGLKSINSQYVAVALVKSDTDTWNLFGDLIT